MQIIKYIAYIPNYHSEPENQVQVLAESDTEVGCISDLAMRQKIRGELAWRAVNRDGIDPATIRIDRVQECLSWITYDPADIHPAWNGAVRYAKV